MILDVITTLFAHKKARPDAELFLIVRFLRLLFQIFENRNNRRNRNSNGHNLADIRR